MERNKDGEKGILGTSTIPSRSDKKCRGDFLFAIYFAHACLCAHPQRSILPASFRAGQKEVIKSLLSGHHILACIPTGAGKSLIYQLAALQLNDSALVISPLTARMKVRVDGLTRRRIPAAY